VPPEPKRGRRRRWECTDSGSVIVGRPKPERRRRHKW
jgi:hypothetical protein